MATIYQKEVTDRTCILSPREYYFRPFDFDNWTEMRMGILFSGVADSGDNTQSTDESVALSSVADLITFGIKDSATSVLPGQAGGLFLGARTWTTQASKSTVAPEGWAFRSGGGGGLAACGFAGTTLIGGTVSEDILPMVHGGAAASSTGYDGFYALKFVINNLGLSTQSVSISSTATVSVSGADYSASALRTLLNNATYGTVRTIAWNDGVSAYDIPDAVWIRMPFYSNRIRLSQPAPMLVRYQP